MIYVASPYSHPNPDIRSGRYNRVLEYCGARLALGEVLFSPVVYGHPFAKAGFAQTDHESWMTFNQHMLLHADSLRVLYLQGWEESVGVQAEVAFAYNNGIAVIGVYP